MTLNNDSRPNARRLPSDPPPRRQGLDAGGAQTGAEGVAAPAAPQTPSPSQSTEAAREATTAAALDAHRRTIVRALLGTLHVQLLPLVLFSLRLWCCAIGAAVEAVDAPPPFGAVVATGDQANDTAARLCAAAHEREAPRSIAAAMVRAAAGVLYDAAGNTSAASVCELLSVVWFRALPEHIDATICRGLPADALADLDAFDGGAPPSPSPANDARAVEAPRVMRAPLASAVLRVDLDGDAPPDPAEHNGRFDGPSTPTGGPSAAELRALVFDAAAYLGCHPHADVSAASAWTLQVMNGGEGECGASALVRFAAELAAVALADARRTSDVDARSVLTWRDTAELAAWGSRVAARAARMCSAICQGAANVCDTDLPDLSPWRSTGAA